MAFKGRVETTKILGTLRCFPKKFHFPIEKVVEAVGIEPAATCTENPEKTDSSLTPPNESAHICAQISGVECPHLAQVVSKWEDLPRSAREAISQLVNTFVKEDLR